MSALPRRLMFLGERRIAWSVLELLNEPRYRDSIDLRALVTDASTGIRHATAWGNPPVIIANDARRTDELLDAISAERIDLLISVQHNWILPSSVLGAVGGQAFNLHNARLPDYKGYNSITHALINGDVSYTSTLHWMSEEVDCGDIAFTGVTSIRPNETAHSLYLRTISAAVGTCDRLFDCIARGLPIPRRALPAKQGRFYPRDSVRHLCDLTGISDPAEVARIARAVFFPPNNVAWFRCGDQVYQVIPAIDWHAANEFSHPLNY